MKKIILGAVLSLVAVSSFAEKSLQVVNNSIKASTMEVNGNCLKLHTNPESSSPAIRLGVIKYVYCRGAVGVCEANIFAGKSCDADSDAIATGVIDLSTATVSYTPLMSEKYNMSYTQDATGAGVLTIEDK